MRALVCCDLVGQFYPFEKRCEKLVIENINGSPKVRSLYSSFFKQAVQKDARCRRLRDGNGTMRNAGIMPPVYMQSRVFHLLETHCLLFNADRRRWLDRDLKDNRHPVGNSAVYPTAVVRLCTHNAVA